MRCNLFMFLLDREYSLLQQSLPYVVLRCRTQSDCNYRMLCIHRMCRCISVSAPLRICHCSKRVDSSYNKAAHDCTDSPMRVGISSTTRAFSFMQRIRTLGLYTFLRSIRSDIRALRGTVHSHLEPNGNRHCLLPHSRFADIRNIFHVSADSPFIARLVGYIRITRPWEYQKLRRISHIQLRKES